MESSHRNISIFAAFDLQCASLSQMIGNPTKQIDNLSMQHTVTKGALLFFLEDRGMFVCSLLYADGWAYIDMRF